MPNYTVLIIDYEPRSTDKLSEYFARAGLTVEIATNGLAGIKAFHTTRPVLTLVEVMLPKRSGLEVCQELKSSPYGKEARIFVMTSRFRSRAYRSQALYQYGADGYLEKPIPESRIQALLDEVLCCHPTKEDSGAVGRLEDTLGGANPAGEAPPTAGAPRSDLDPPG